jgi:hypothetical protein
MPPIFATPPPRHASDFRCHAAAAAVFSAIAARCRRFSQIANRLPDFQILPPPFQLRSMYSAFLSLAAGHVSYDIAEMTRHFIDYDAEIRYFIFIIFLSPLAD